MVKVSVIVAVYNPGHDIDELLESLDGQSMPQDEFEVIFADDDSTDGTRERLQEWATTRANARVLHNTPNSGWPGRPRNLGIDNAQGEYLFFADNDDKLATGGLESMYQYASDNDSDVVIAKEVGVGPGRGVPRGLFATNIPDAKLGVDPILGILTPHKLVRTSLVRDHGIRFPEGRVRLEDHFFMVSCYFAASKISVLADQLCYYWMRRTGDGDNASFGVVEPSAYYASVERVLAVVEQNTGPGDFRNQLYSHWYTAKMLNRLRGGSLLQHPESYQRDLVAELRRVSARFGLDEQLLPYLGAGGRARAQLLMHGSLEDIQALGAAERGVSSRVRLHDVHWTEDGKLSLTIRSDFAYADGDPLTLRHTGDRTVWDIAERVPGLALEPIDVTDLVDRVGVRVLMTDRSTLDVRIAPGNSTTTPDNRVGAITEAMIDPVLAFRDKPCPSILDLRARLIGLGWSSEVRVPAPRGTLPATGHNVAAGVVTAYATQGPHNLSLRLGEPTAPGAPKAPAVVQSVPPADEDADFRHSWRTIAGLAARRAVMDVQAARRWATGLRAR